MKGPMKWFVAFFTFTLLLIGGCGLSQLKMEFRPEWLMDPTAEGKFILNILNAKFLCSVTKWYTAHKQYFPSDGESGVLYFRVTYNCYLHKFEEIHTLECELLREFQQA